MDPSIPPRSVDPQRLVSAWLGLLGVRGPDDRARLAARLLEAAEGLPTGSEPPPPLPPGCVVESREVEAEPEMDYSASVWWARSVLEPGGSWRTDLWEAGGPSGDDTADANFDALLLGRGPRDLRFHEGRGRAGLPRRRPDRTARGRTLEESREGAAEAGPSLGEYGPLGPEPSPAEARLLAAAGAAAEAVLGSFGEDEDGGGGRPEGAGPAAPGEEGAALSPRLLARARAAT